MAEPVTGTPNATPEGAAGGTPAAGGDDGKGGRTPTADDLKALAKTHEDNLVKERAKVADLEAKVNALLTQRATATAPPADPVLEGLQSRASYDENAAAILNLTDRLAQQAQVADLNTQVLEAIYAAGVPPERVSAVKQFIANSGYKMSVKDADRLARGLSMDKVESEKSELAKENERLKKELEAAKTRVPNMAMTPAVPVVDAAAEAIPASTYNAVLDRGGPQARALMERTKIPKGQPGHLEVEFGS